MGSGGSFFKGLKLGIGIKVALVLLPTVMGMIKSRSGSGLAKAYVSPSRGGGTADIDPAVIARNIQRSQYRILNSGRPPSLTHRERGGRRTVYQNQQPIAPAIVDDDEINVGITGFPGYTNMNLHYYSMLGGRRR